MKSAEEISAYLDALEVGLQIPCRCAGTTHENNCREGGNMVRATIRVLRWTLGRAEDHQARVDQLVRNAKEYRDR